MERSQGALYIPNSGAFEDGMIWPGDAHCGKEMPTAAPVTTPSHRQASIPAEIDAITATTQKKPSSPVYLSASVNQSRLSSRRYVCPNCDKITFRKAVFKRHFTDCHERDYTYPCDHDNCHEIFNVPTQFAQHHRKWHDCQGPCGHAERSKQRNPGNKLRRGCGVCSHVAFSLDAWLDHLAGHYEEGFQKEHWNPSLVVFSLLSQQQNIVEAWGQLTPAQLPWNGWHGGASLQLQSRLEKIDSPAMELAMELAKDAFSICASQAMDFRRKATVHDPSQLAPSIFNGNRTTNELSIHHHTPSSFANNRNFMSAEQSFFGPRFMGTVHESSWAHDAGNPLNETALQCSLYKGPCTATTYETVPQSNLCGYPRTGCSGGVSPYIYQPSAPSIPAPEIKNQSFEYPRRS